MKTCYLLACSLHCLPAKSFLISTASKEACTINVVNLILWSVYRVDIEHCTDALMIDRDQHQKNKHTEVNATCTLLLLIKMQQPTYQMQTKNYFLQHK